MAVVGVLGDARPRPFLEFARVVDRDTAASWRASLATSRRFSLFDAEFLAGGEQGGEDVLGDGDVVGRVGDQAVLGRVAHVEPVLAVGILGAGEEILVEQRDLLRQRDETLREELPVAGEQPVVVVEMQQPAGDADGGLFAAASRPSATAGRCWRRATLETTPRKPNIFFALSRQSGTHESTRLK